MFSDPPISPNHATIQTAGPRQCGTFISHTTAPASYGILYPSSPRPYTLHNGHRSCFRLHRHDRPKRPRAGPPTERTSSRDSTGAPFSPVPFPSLGNFNDGYDVSETTDMVHNQQRLFMGLSTTHSPSQSTRKSKTRNSHSL